MNSTQCPQYVQDIIYLKLLYLSVCCERDSEYILRLFFSILQYNALFSRDDGHNSSLSNTRGEFRECLHALMPSQFNTMINSLLYFVVVMRTHGSLRVILNTKIWPGMTIERASNKSVRITATDGDEGVKVFLIMVCS